MVSSVREPYMSSDDGTKRMNEFQDRVALHVICGNDFFREIYIIEYLAMYLIRSIRVERSKTNLCAQESMQQTVSYIDYLPVSEFVYGFGLVCVSEVCCDPEWISAYLNEYLDEYPQEE